MHACMLRTLFRNPCQITSQVMLTSHRHCECVRLLTVKKNHYIFSSQLRADQMPGPPRVGQLMCTLFLSMRQVKYQLLQDACRYHPHLQGSTALQAQTASGPITIDSDIDFLTPQKGCGPLSTLLQGVQTRILYLQTMFFEDADVENDPA